ncbi:centromere protein P isoform X2 [Denticeps clupeoides]|nr:centromere protein P isoform X2 [Denticeps clupeoides]
MIRKSAAMEQEYEEEIQKLREEIAFLQAEKENDEREIAKQHGDNINHILESISKKLEMEGGRLRQDKVSKLVYDIQKLEQDLLRQTRINGIVLTDVCEKTTEKSEDKCVQQHRITGHCLDLTFQVEFEVTETMTDDTFLRRVTDLNIVVDGNEFKDISSLVSRVEESKSLLLFFRTLRDVSEKCALRKKTFNHFKERCPDVISLPNGSQSEVMVIKSPKLPRCTISILWKINTTNGGVITPKIELLMEMHEKALSPDNKKVLENAPDAFQSLLRVFGVEAAIENIIKTVGV